MSKPILQNVPLNNPFSMAIATETDLSALLYLPVTVSGGEVVGVSEGATALGILQNAPKGASGVPQTADVVFAGLAKVYLDATIAAGSYLKVGAGNTVVQATADKDIYFAITLDDGEAGDLVAVVIVQGTLSA
jgi:hypothetical protein